MLLACPIGTDRSEKVKLLHAVKTDFKNAVSEQLGALLI